MTYAAKTSVAVEKTRGEIEKLVTKHKATRFASGWEANAANVMFDMRDRRVRFTLPLPKDSDFRHRPNGSRRNTLARIETLHAQALRSKWRALFLVIKAKLEGVEAGVETFEAAFLAHIVVPGTGETVGDRFIPELASIYEGAPMRPLLGA